MPDLSASPDDYDGADAYAHAQASNAKHTNDSVIFAVGGTDIAQTTTEYAVEPAPGWNARGVTDEMAGAIEDIVDYRDGARLITREVTYGPWRYVTPEEIETVDARKETSENPHVGWDDPDDCGTDDLDEFIARDVDTVHVYLNDGQVWTLNFGAAHGYANAEQIQ